MAALAGAVAQEKRRLLPPLPSRVPVAPDAIQQLHEGEGEVEAEEKEEVSGGLI